jgi:hypothetical protein
MSEPKKPSPEKPIDRRRFFEAAEELIDRNRALSLEVDWLLRRAENVLCRRPLHQKRAAQDKGPGLSPREMILFYLQRMKPPIGELMRAYDLLCCASDYGPQFNFVFQFFRVPRSIRDKVRRLLEHGLTLPPDP